MYKEHFGFIEKPFSIVPNARYLFLSSRHREAMTHLQAGLGEGGGFAMLTGEVGTGKTTVSKAMLSSLDEDIDAGLILNPTFSETDLLEAICDEFKLEYPSQASLKQLSKVISDFLHTNYDKGRQTLLLIDEAQHLSAQVLEQLRLLTNLETDSQKLLKVLLIGQPELQEKLQTAELRQLAQRITGRYHLLPLTEKEVISYIGFRLKTAGTEKPLFSKKALKIVAEKTGGIPRLINLVCDKSLQYAYYSGEKEVNADQARKASEDVMSFQAPGAVHKESTSRSSLASLNDILPLKAMVLSGVALAASFYFSPQIQILTESQLAPLPAIQNSSPEQGKAGDDLIQFMSESESEVEAMQVLYRLWGVEASVMDASCIDGATYPYSCESRSGGMSDILAQNRPVVLALNSDGNISYVVLYAFYHDQVELLNGRQRLRVPLNWLKKHWNGGYKSLWYNEIRHTLKQGSYGRDVSMLDTLIAKAMQEAPLDTDYFDQTMKKRVKAFQSWQGLDSDGVAGKQTLRTLELRTNEKAPELIKAPGVIVKGGES